jgi:hypothetical protein
VKTPKSRLRLAVKIAAGIVAASILVTGCGGSEQSVEPTGPVALSDDQAARLAQAGFTNFQEGGAQFEANSAFLVGQPAETLRLVGEVDWVRRSGWAMVSGTGPDVSLTEVYWESDVVLERRPAVDAIIAGRGAHLRLGLLAHQNRGRDNWIV